MLEFEEQIPVPNKEVIAFPDVMCVPFKITPSEDLQSFVADRLKQYCEAEAQLSEQRFARYVPKLSEEEFASLSKEERRARRLISCQLANLEQRAIVAAGEVASAFEKGYFATGCIGYDTANKSDPDYKPEEHNPSGIIGIGVMAVNLESDIVAFSGASQSAFPAYQQYGEEFSAYLTERAEKAYLHSYSR